MSIRLPNFIWRHWLTVAFVAGFFSDLILLNKVDDLFDNLILLLYVLLATVSLILFYAAVAARLGDWWSAKLYFLTQLTLPYALGGLFSGMLIFYGRSGDLMASWPFLLLIIGAILGNELIHDRGRRLVFNVLAYFVGLFSYLVLVVPVFTGFLGAWVFVSSGLVALAIVYGVIKILTKFIPHYLKIEMRSLVFAVFGMFVLLNGFYFMNLIPPIPLSLKEITIAHSVIRFPATGEYEIKYEGTPWWNLLAYTRPTIHPTPGLGVSCFTNVFAPAKIKTDIYHQWDFYNEQMGAWQERFRRAYPISGEATNGYRGYTTILSIEPGKWRCSVKNTRGDLLGHKVFYIDTSSRAEEISTIIK